MDNELLKKLHEVQLEIMDEIHKLCVTNGITYYLAGGSVLGAVRHGGFIPWDDDIDICMPRKDYLRFCEICKTELSSRLFLQNMDTDKYYGKFIAKVRRNSTIFLEEAATENKAHNGIFIDVFILDDAKELVGKQYRFEKIIWKCSAIIEAKRGWRKSTTLGKIIYFCISEKILRSIQTYLLTFYNEKELTFYVNYGSQYGVRKQTFSKAIYGQPRLMTFEGREYYVPLDVDAFLKQLYGAEYMRLPPKEKRVCHNPIRLEFPD